MIDSFRNTDQMLFGIASSNKSQANTEDPSLTSWTGANKSYILRSRELNNLQSHSQTAKFSEYLVRVLVEYKQ